MTFRGGLGRQALDALMGEIPTHGILWGFEVLMPASGLTALQDGGFARLVSTTAGKLFDEYAIAPSSRAYTASRDTYVLLLSNGVVGYSEVLNGAAKPTLASLGHANGEFLAKVVTDGSNVTSVDDLRELAASWIELLAVVNCSFQTAELGAIADIPIPYPCRLIALVSKVNLALAGTDAGTITPARIRNGVAATITGGVVTHPLSSAIGARVMAVPTLVSNPDFVPGDSLRLTTAKATAGGRTNCGVLVQRQG